MAIPLFIGAISTGGRTPFYWGGSTNFSDFEFNPTNAVCNITLNTNGSGSTTAGQSGTMAGWWRGFPSTGIGTGKYVKCVYVSGDTLDTGTTGSWQELSTARTFGISDTTAGNGSRSGVYYFEFGFSASGPAAFTSPNITITATKDVL